MENENRVVRLPLYNKETGENLPGYLEVDTTFFLSSVRGLRSTQARIVEEFHYSADPVLTPNQELDLVERIISGLPPRPEYKSLQWPPLGTVVVEPDLEEGVKLYDVNSLYPQEVANWTRIPTWDNYEINGLGQVRNRWTKRILDYVDDGEDNEDYVEMHDKEGYSHMCHTGYLKEQTFGA
ncbi:hypothetical protein SEA_GIANTSBANE_78 [Arthrobacter phage Giantsbane]|nr:hypothetical protein SEA_GIANTSBANE_78 [Arthrobacter phage Giantsbane]